MSKNNLAVEQADLDAFSEESYLIKDSIKVSKEILKNEKLLYKGTFEEDNWIFLKDNTNSGNKIKFNFNILDSYKNKELSNVDFKSLVKCWVAEFTPKVTIQTVKEYYSLLIKSLEYTNGLKKNKVDSFINWIQKDSSYSNDYKKAIIRALLNFFDYSELTISNYYNKPLFDLNRKIKSTLSNRELPSSKDILTFSMCLEDFFNKLDQEKKLSKQLMSFYPLLIWWKLTNVIPMRPSEFCLIERECLAHDSYRIKLPRSKYSKSHPNVVDSLKISKDIYNLIQYYIDETEEFGHSQTLISYRSIIWASEHKVRRTREVLKNNYEVFTLNILKELIVSFYRDIVFKQYNYDVKKQIKPNDTRHFAIISLKYQGVSPIEIARLANHKTVEAQYHYSFHTEYWIDSEVVKLMNKFKFQYRPIAEEEAAEKDTKLISHVPQTIKLKAFAPNTTPGFELKCRDIGKCTDILHRCETTDDCIFCSHWRTTPEELVEKNELLRAKINNRKKKIHELTSVIDNMHTNMLSNESARQNPINLNRLKTSTNQIQECLNQISDIKMLESQVTFK